LHLFFVNKKGKAACSMRAVNHIDKSEVMMNKILNTKTNKSEKYFFEFTGIPGRIYIDDFEFGQFLQNEGSASLRLQGPVVIYPSGGLGWNPLYKALTNLYSAGNKQKVAHHECLIRLERTQGNRTVTETIYQLLDIKLLNIYRINEQRAYYEFDFDNMKSFQLKWVPAIF
jgi:hypothetical protein